MVSTVPELVERKLDSLAVIATLGDRLKSFFSQICLTGTAF
jgi:hypothetical protein